MKKFFKQLKEFLINTSQDSRIPSRDKKIVMALVALILSPIDLIPDWIPFFGLIDDVIILAIVLDYFFETLDQAIILSHYPWNMKSYARAKRLARSTSALVPGFIKNNIWSYTKEPY